MQPGNTYVTDWEGQTETVKHNEGQVNLNLVNNHGVSVMWHSLWGNDCDIKEEVYIWDSNPYDKK